MGTLVKTNGDLFPAIPSVFSDFFNSDFFSWPTGHNKNQNTVPAVNVKEAETQYQLEVAVPGMSKEDFTIELENNQLSISAEKRNNTDEENEHYTRKEFNYQSFKRSFNLSKDVVDQEAISANYADGILHINIPKKENDTVSPVRQIEIS